MDTRPPRTAADERATLLGFLDYLRAAIADKAVGVPDPQVRAPGVPSGTSLLGLIKHLTIVERFYFLSEDVDDWGKTMRPAPEETVEAVLAGYREAIERANKVIDTYPDLALPAPRPPRRGSAPSMRWVMVHMIEETGRHAGHADILGGWYSCLRRCRPDPGERHTGGDVFPDSRPQPNVEPTSRGRAQQPLQVHDLDIAGSPGRDGHRMGGNGRQVAASGQFSDHRERIALDHPHYVIDLN
jgi:hypothetical protein